MRKVTTDDDKAARSDACIDDGLHWRLHAIRMHTCHSATLLHSSRRPAATLPCVTLRIWTIHTGIRMTTNTPGTTSMVLANGEEGRPSANESSVWRQWHHHPPSTSQYEETVVASSKTMGSQRRLRVDFISSITLRTVLFYLMSQKMATIVRAHVNRY